MDINELEHEEVAPSAPVSDLDTEQQMLVDMMDAMSLMTSAVHMMNFVADPILCKSMSKRERRTMLSLVEKMKEFLDEMKVSYETGGS